MSTDEEMLEGRCGGDGIGNGSGCGTGSEGQGMTTAAAATILQLPPVGLEHDECGICLDSLSEGAVASLSGNLHKGCAHKFHFECIADWAKVENRCPLCKASFSKLVKTDARTGQLMSQRSVRTREQ